MHLLFDIGGTRTRFAISDGETLQNIQVFKTIQNYQEAIDFIKNNIQKITQGNLIEKISGGIAGVVVDNQLYKAPHLSDWNDKDIKSDFLKLFNASEFTLKNDASLAGLAESILGAGKDFNIVAYITIGTGVGGVRIVNQKIDKTTIGFEPGHQIIGLNNDNIITAEDLISGSAIERDYGKRASQIEDESFWREMEIKIGYVLNNIMLMWSPEIIILGGGIINSNLINIVQVENHLKNFNKVFPDIPNIRKVELNDEVGLHGAMLNLKTTSN